MADSGGFWITLEEAQKLTQEFVVPGIIQEHVRTGGLISILPMSQAKGKSIKWNRESTERDGRRANRGTTLVWTDDMAVTQQEEELKTIYDQSPLDHFVSEVYNTFNNYEAIQFMGMQKGMLKTIEDAIIYDNTDYNVDHFHGLHYWGDDAKNGPGTDDASLSIDQAEAGLSLQNMRVLEDSMKYGIDFWLAPKNILRRLSAYYQEGEAGTGDTNTRRGSFIWAPNQVGQRIAWWNGTPIIASDYLVAEQANTGVGSDARAKHSSGDAQYTMFAIKAGQVMTGEPGVGIGFGGEQNDLGQLIKTVRFADLEDFDAAGLRMVSYLNLMAGSYKAVGRIFDIEDVEVTP